ncbi:MAG: T9SS type A sorting domain-containing protein, partial [Calditrichota bacterium]
TLPQATAVQLRIYNVLGQEVGTLVDETLQAGKYDIKFEARGLAAGLYFYRIQADRFVETRKMLLVK